MLQVYDKNFAALDAKGMDEVPERRPGLDGAAGLEVPEPAKFDPAKIPSRRARSASPVRLLRKGRADALLDRLRLDRAAADVLTASRRCSSEDGERPEFNAFVKSFKLLSRLEVGPLLAYLPFIALSFFVGTAVF